MTLDRNDPLWVERLENVGGLAVHRQAAPPGSASVSVSYLAPAGWAYDPPGAEGTAQAVAQLVTTGAGALDRVDLARRLDELGASLSAQCDSESSEVTIWGPRDTFEALVRILGDAILSPRLDVKEVEKLRRQMFERQLREASQPESRAERAMLKALFPHAHPYGESGIGTRRSVGRLSREGLRKFHRDHYTEEGASLIVTASQPAPTVRALVARRFRGFERVPAPAPPSLPPVPPSEPRRELLEMGGRTQVEIRMAGISVPRSSPHYPSVYLANQILGGRSMLSRLYQRIRERAGLAYHASSEVESMRWGGFWVAEAGTGPERVDRTVALLEKEVTRMSGELVGPAELDLVRESAIGELPLELEDTNGAHELAMDVAYHGLAPDFYRTWRGVLRSLTPSDLRRGAEVGLDGTRATTVLAGPLGRERKAPGR